MIEAGDSEPPQREKQANQRGNDDHNCSPRYDYEHWIATARGYWSMTKMLCAHTGISYPRPQQRHRGLAIDSLTYQECLHSYRATSSALFSAVALTNYRVKFSSWLAMSSTRTRAPCSSVSSRALTWSFMSCNCRSRTLVHTTAQSMAGHLPSCRSCRSRQQNHC